MEINIFTYPNVVEAILENGMFSYYNRPRISQLCKEAGLYVELVGYTFNLTICEFQNIVFYNLMMNSSCCIRTVLNVLLRILMYCVSPIYEGWVFILFCEGMKRFSARLLKPMVVPEDSLLITVVEMIYAILWGDNKSMVLKFHWWENFSYLLTFLKSRLNVQHMCFFLLGNGLLNSFMDAGRVLITM